MFFLFFFLVDFFTSGLFYLEISVKVANSRSYGPISILTEVLEIHIFTSGGLFKNKLLDFSMAKKLLDFSMEMYVQTKRGHGCAALVRTAV